MLGRPYHHDPYLNHEILEEFQKLGYPIFSQSRLPLDEDLLERLFRDEVRADVIKHPLDIADVWKTPPARTTRSGRRNSPRGTRIWLRWKFRTSSAGTMRRSTA
jgi:predicted nucleotide-binding protein (sugar kinase/HSP70/actin superfamily)